MMTSIICSIPLVGHLLGACATPLPLAAGYVEGEYVLVAPLATARIEDLEVQRGTHVKKGDPLGRLEARDANIAVAQAKAAFAQAQSTLQDLNQGRRPEELAVLETAVEQAKANLDNLQHGARPEELAVLEAAVAQAQANLDNLKQGARTAEIAVIEAALAAARASASDALAAYNRERELARRGITSEARLEKAKAALDAADASVDQAQANLDVARLPARPDQIRAAEAQLAQARANLNVAGLPGRDAQIKAAQAQVAQAEANLAVARLPARADQIKAAQAALEQARAAVEQAEWQRDQRMLVAPRNGLVTDIIRNPGELAGPSAPILTILPDGGVKLRLYVPEPALASVSIGTQLNVECDGCKDSTATVSYIADTPEFTPPVIYSLENRQKLVWLVEARPGDAAAGLKPGQIIDVRLAAEETDR